MQLHLVRHGETDWNAGKRIQGTIDIDLNASGRRQAEELGTTLASAGIAFTGIRTSTMKRARSTAQILESFLGLPAVEAPNLHEMDFGSWEGLTWPEVDSQYPAVFQSWLKERRTTRVPGGESYDTLLSRVLPALAALDQDGVAGELLVVTHGAVILSLRCLMSRTDFSEMDRFRVANLERVVVGSDVIRYWAGEYAGGPLPWQNGSA